MSQEVRPDHWAVHGRNSAGAAPDRGPQLLHPLLREGQLAGTTGGAARSSLIDPPCPVQMLCVNASPSPLSAHDS